MKPTLLALFLCFGFTMSGQDDGFVSGMKMVKASMEAGQKLETKTGPKMMAVGERIGSVYENMIPFWRQRYAADAVKWSEEGKTAAAMLASAAHANDEAKVAEAMKAIGATCKPCHDARREKTPEGKYKVK
jgi:cytochrome c556